MLGGHLAFALAILVKSGSISSVGRATCLAQGGVGSRPAWDQRTLGSTTIFQMVSFVGLNAHEWLVASKRLLSGNKSGKPNDT